MKHDIYLSNQNVDKNAYNGTTILLDDHHHHHHHHHHHNYFHSPTIMSIITGDGMHNFCDGLAIGVAFESGFYVGLSTSIAILCHELPHEIGDFAVLIKAGLPVRTAIKYNILSSILAFIGMAVGIMMGNVFSGKLNAVIAGMFLHIALVDMMPQLELSNQMSKLNSAKLFVMQLIGITLGIIIMFLVSMFE